MDSLASDDQVDKPVAVERFSKQYFDLAANFGKELGPVLQLKGKLLVILDGQAYLFN